MAYIGQNELDYMESLAEKVINMNKGRVDQRIFSVEECIETTVELMNLAKSLTKNIRGKEDYSVLALISEYIDVFASGYLTLRTMGISGSHIIHEMTRKYERALKRYEESGEL